MQRAECNAAAKDVARRFHLGEGVMPLSADGETSRALISPRETDLVAPCPRGFAGTRFADCDCANALMAWTYVIDEAALPDSKMLPVYPLGVNVLVARVGGALYAVSGSCAHMACPLLLGTLDGHTLTCSCHDWRFDIRTGRLLDAPALGIATYRAKSERGHVFVNLEREDK